MNKMDELGQTFGAKVRPEDVDPSWPILRIIDDRTGKLIQRIAITEPVEPGASFVLPKLKLTLPR